MKKTINDFDKLQIDKYGNNIAFPDSIMSDITIKGLLGKWTSLIYSNIKHALYKYYMNDRNIDAGDKNYVISLFKNANNMISALTPVLEDLVHINIYGMEDIFIAVYGITSDEVYVFRKYMKRAKEMSSWDEDYMWNNCESDSRLKKILLNQNN